MNSTWILQTPKPPPQLGGEHPLLRPPPLGAFGASFLGASGASYSMPLNSNPVSAPGDNTWGQQDSETFSFFYIAYNCGFRERNGFYLYIFRYRPRNIGADAVVLGPLRAEAAVKNVDFAAVGGK